MNSNLEDKVLWPNFTRRVSVAAATYQAKEKA